MLRKRPVESLATAAMVNWTVLLACVQWLVPQAGNLLDLFRLDLGFALWCVAALAAASKTWSGENKSDCGSEICAQPAKTLGDHHGHSPRANELARN